MGFSPKQKYGGWSVAMTDGMMNGVPYIMYDDTYYHELNAKGDFFKNDDEALMLMNTYLDNPDFRNEQAEQALDCIRENLIYKDKIFEMIKNQNLNSSSHIIEVIKRKHNCVNWQKFNIYGPLEDIKI